MVTTGTDPIVLFAEEFCGPERTREPADSERPASPEHAGDSSELNEPTRPLAMSPARFDELVSAALDEIPPPLAQAMDNVVVLVEDEHPEEPDLLGLYEGIALTERTTNYAGALPDRITVYRNPILAMCRNEDEVAHEILVTVVHEVAHHFGFDDQTLRRLGWD